MSKYRRNFVPGGVYFFTIVTYRRRPILTQPVSRLMLRKAIRSVRKRMPFTIDAMVLLPDHLHCVWTLPPSDDAYPSRWRQIKSLFTRGWLATGGQEWDLSLSRINKEEHSIWQRRYFEHTCETEVDMKRCIDYAHINPLKHGLVQKVVDWPWSSFHRYVRMGEYTADWGSVAEWYGDEWRYFE